MPRKTKTTATLTDSKGRVLAEDKGDGDGLQEVGDNLKESLAEIGFTPEPAPRVLFDEHDNDYLAPVDAKGEIKYDTKSGEMVKHAFTDKERAELSASAGQLDLEANSLKANLDSIKKQMQGEIDAKHAQVSNILQKCRDGYEYRDTAIGVLYHVPQKGTKAIVRLDREEVIRTVPMAPHELQSNLFNEETGGAQPDEETGASNESGDESDQPEEPWT